MADPVPLLIMGAGPAGLAAAQEAVAAGVGVLLLDEQATGGGQIYRALGEATGERQRTLGADYAAGAPLFEVLSAQGLDHQPGATVWEVTPDGTTLVVTYKGDHAVGLFALADGSERAVVPSSRRIPHGVAVSPDSRYAFITVEGVANDPGTVDVIDLETGTLAASVDVGRQAGGIGFWKMERKQDRK